MAVTLELLCYNLQVDLNRLQSKKIIASVGQNSIQMCVRPVHRKFFILIVS